MTSARMSLEKNQIGLFTVCYIVAVSLCCLCDGVWFCGRYALLELWVTCMAGYLNCMLCFSLQFATYLGLSSSSLKHNIRYKSIVTLADIIS